MSLTIKQPYSFSQYGQRDNQEDALCPAVMTEETRFFAVCDGVGGRDKGEVASGLVCQTIEQTLLGDNEQCLNMTKADFEEILLRCYETLYDNRKVSKSMATTLAFLSIRKDSAFIAHIGDSRIYQIRRKEGIIYRSADHSLVEEMLRKGKITEEEAHTHPQRNIITRCLYITEKRNRYSEATIDIIHDIHPGDIFMLCTDGVSDELTDKNIEAILTADSNLENKASVLSCQCANSSDNNTAILIEINEAAKGTNANVDRIYTAETTISDSRIELMMKNVLSAIFGTSSKNLASSSNTKKNI